ncbi:MAG: hypothetical protein KDI49_18680, partial [Gammaproteobacteria bacterium]|nr:hypothetical protein [Gammaproteobacteria bacterium]
MTGPIAMNHASVAILAPDEMQVTVLPRRKGGMNMTQALDRNATISILNRILELELAGVVRYTHYALMVYGYSRIPIVGWLNTQADESLLHARQAGEL